MPNQSLKDALISPYVGLSEERADEAIEEMRELVVKGEDPEDLLDAYGLEPDYVLELLV